MSIEIKSVNVKQSEGNLFDFHGFTAEAEVTVSDEEKAICSLFVSCHRSNCLYDGNSWNNYYISRRSLIDEPNGFFFDKSDKEIFEYNGATAYEDKDIMKIYDNMTEASDSYFQNCFDYLTKTVSKAVISNYQPSLTYDLRLKHKDIKMNILSLDNFETQMAGELMFYGEKYDVNIIRSANESVIDVKNGYEIEPVLKTRFGSMEHCLSPFYLASCKLNAWGMEKLRSCEYDKKSSAAVEDHDELLKLRHEIRRLSSVYLERLCC